MSGETHKEDGLGGEWHVEGPSAQAGRSGEHGEGPKSEVGQSQAIYGPVRPPLPTGCVSLSGTLYLSESWLPQPENQAKNRLYSEGCCRLE